MTGKGSNVLPVWGNEKTMNLNNMILTNIQSSPYFKVQLFDLKTYHEVIDEIFYKVNHLEPWEKGSRKLSGQTGMCGGVRGVGTGGIVSSAFCLLYKLYTLKLTRKQLTGLLNHADSPYIRGLGFMYIRYTQPPPDLWDWMEPYLDDDEEVDVKAGGGCIMTIGEMCREFLFKLDWYSALFPRIPVPIQKDLDMKMRSRPPVPRAIAAQSYAEDEGGAEEPAALPTGGRGSVQPPSSEGGRGRVAEDGPSTKTDARNKHSPDSHRRKPDDDYLSALEREKERQRKVHHRSPRSSPSHRHHSSDSKQRRSRSPVRSDRRRSTSRDNHRSSRPAAYKAGRPERSPSRDKSYASKHGERPFHRSQSREAQKRHRSRSAEQRKAANDHRDSSHGGHHKSSHHRGGRSSSRDRGRRNGNVSPDDRGVRRDKSLERERKKRSRSRERHSYNSKLSKSQSVEQVDH